MGRFPPVDVDLQLTILAGGLVIVDRSCDAFDPVHAGKLIEISVVAESTSHKTEALAGRKESSCGSRFARALTTGTDNLCFNSQNRALVPVAAACPCSRRTT